MINLYDYQFEAVCRLQNGNILCGGVGSGKSLTSLAYYYIQNGGELTCLTIPNSSYVDMVNPKDLYIITTARKRDTHEWEKELAPFLLSTDEKLNHYSNKVVIDSWNNLHKYTDATDAFFIFDEQRVVGKGEWVKSFLKITRGGNQWILLSATPGDTWLDYVPVFIANGFFKNRTEFNNEHVVWKFHRNYYTVDRYMGVRKLTQLRDKILVDMDFHRDTISHHEDIRCEYDVKKYRDVMKYRWNPWKEQPIENASEYCYILRHVVNEDDSRQAAVLEIFEDHPRVIIFYNFDYELEILKNLPYWTVTGEEVVIAEWNGWRHQPIPESDSWVYLVQYAAGAEGWNCIKTDTIIFYSQNYSYKMTEQAAGRIDRLNTPYKHLYYYHLKSDAPLDRAISRALSEKKNFSEAGFSGRMFKRDKSVS